MGMVEVSQRTSPEAVEESPKGAGKCVRRMEKMYCSTLLLNGVLAGKSMRF